MKNTATSHSENGGALTGVATEQVQQNDMSSLISFAEDNQYIWITPVIEFFDLSYDFHRKLVKKDLILSSNRTLKSDYLMYGDNRKRVLLTKKGFLRWIQLITVKSIRPELRTQFAQFQEMVVDYLYATADRYNQELTEEATLYAEIQHKKAEKVRLYREIRAAEAQLKALYKKKYGNVQLALMLS